MHSGVYGGSALNALHALHTMLGAVVPAPTGACARSCWPASRRRPRPSSSPGPGSRRATRCWRGRRAAGLPGAGAGVLRAQRRAAVAGDQRHPRRASTARWCPRWRTRASRSAWRRARSAQDALATLERLLREALRPGPS
jgi:hypothetical protein